MTVEELTSLLRHRCLGAPPGDRSVVVHLFGIQFAEQIPGDCEPKGSLLVPLSMWLQSLTIRPPSTTPSP